MKKVYDLSIANQSANERRVLIADSGKEYDVSFVPAIINRRYHTRWTESQQEVLLSLNKFVAIQKDVESGEELTQEKLDVVNKFVAISKEAAQCGMDLIVYTMKVNGYDEFDEEELLINFSEKSISGSISFIMGTEDKKKATKKPRAKKKSS